MRLPLNSLKIFQVLSSSVSLSIDLSSCCARTHTHTHTHAHTQRMSDRTTYTHTHSLTICWAEASVATDIPTVIITTETYFDKGYLKQYNKALFRLKVMDTVN